MLLVMNLHFLNINIKEFHCRPDVVSYILPVFPRTRQYLPGILVQTAIPLLIP